MKQMLKLAISLSAYAVVSCLCLALVNGVTAPVIELHEKETLENGLREVFSKAKSFSEPLSQDLFEEPATGKIKNAYTAFDEQKNPLGVVVEIYGKTYDTADILIGFSNDKELSVTGVKFLSLTDSPGFGQKAQDPKFTVKSGKTFFGQFEGKSAKTGFTLDSNFDGISGATITSRTVGNLITQAAKTALQILENAGE